MIDLIIPFYNAHSFLKNALDSIVRQTIKNNIVVTIVDDGSNISVKKILDSYQNQLEIKVISFKKNHGPGYAKQYGIKHTNNPYLFFLDADDELIGEYGMEEMYNIAQKFPDLNIISGKEKNNNTITYRNNHMVGKLIKRSFLKEFHLKVPNYPREEDVAFSLAMFSMAEKNTIYYYDQPVYKYRHVNLKSITKKLSKDNGYSFEFVFKGIDYAFGYCKKYKKYTYFNKKIYEIFLFLASQFYSYFYKSNIEQKNKYLKNTFKLIKKYTIYFDNFEKKAITKYEISDYKLVMAFYKLVLDMY